MAELETHPQLEECAVCLAERRRCAHVRQHFRDPSGIFADICGPHAICVTCAARVIQVSSEALERPGQFLCPICHRSLGFRAFHHANDDSESDNRSHHLEDSLAAGTEAERACQSPSAPLLRDHQDLQRRVRESPTQRGQLCKVEDLTSPAPSVKVEHLSSPSPWHQRDYGLAPFNAVHGLIEFSDAQLQHEVQRFVDKKTALSSAGIDINGHDVARVRDALLDKSRLGQVLKQLLGAALRGDPGLAWCEKSCREFIGQLHVRSSQGASVLGGSSPHSNLVPLRGASLRVDASVPHTGSEYSPRPDAYEASTLTPAAESAGVGSPCKAMGAPSPTAPASPATLSPPLDSASLAELASPPDVGSPGACAVSEDTLAEAVLAGAAAVLEAEQLGCETGSPALSPLVSAAALSPSQEMAGGPSVGLSSPGAPSNALSDFSICTRSGVRDGSDSAVADSTPNTPLAAPAPTASEALPVSEDAPMEASSTPEALAAGAFEDCPASAVKTTMNSLSADVAAVPATSAAEAAAAAAVAAIAGDKAKGSRRRRRGAPREALPSLLAVAQKTAMLDRPLQGLVGRPRRPPRQSPPVTSSIPADVRAVLRSLALPRGWKASKHSEDLPPPAEAELRRAMPPADADFRTYEGPRSKRARLAAGLGA